MTRQYMVVWRIEVDADSPEQAAAMALAIQRDPESTATWFEVDGSVREYNGLPEEEQ